MRVRVRMYRQGLGDCYLLTFGTGNGAKHVLIDCGTLGTTNANSMDAVVASIKATTNGHLDLIVATHEHKDHLSGMAKIKAAFQAANVDRFWVAWTENPADELARDLKKYADDLGLAAAAGVRAMRAVAKTDVAGAADLERRADQAAEILTFFGEDVLGEGAFGANVFAPTIHAAMELVRTRFGSGEADYLQPDNKLKDVSDWLPGFRVYVLGPPRSKTSIADTGEEGGGDLYPYPAAGILAAADAVASPAGRRRPSPADKDDDRFANEVPFDLRFQVPDRTELAHPRLYPSYADETESWRRVDADWLGFSSILALQLDNRTNNTSVVLAFERISDGKVLLFPADAQRGNWQSWSVPNELTWTLPGPNGTTSTVTTSDLLKRTVFYKVGHHSSHNATAKEHGLEKMVQNSLVAFIPLDRTVAKNKGWNTMPTRALYKRLMEKCKGRVARSDLGWVTETAEQEFTSMFDAAEWQAFRDEQQAVEQAGTVAFDPLFVDYILI